ncbi:MAG: PAS domain S-box protein [Pseudomonadota bacterium]
MKRISLQQKILFIFGFFFLLIIGAVMFNGVISFKNTSAFMLESLNESAAESAKNHVFNSAKATGNRIIAEFEAALNSARTLAYMFSAVRDVLNLKMDREQIDGVLRGVVVKNSQFVGAYSCWEPDALDNQDDLYAGKGGTDLSGRFISYWQKKGRRVRLNVLEDYENKEMLPNGQRKGEYYLLPKERKKECIIDPHPQSIKNGSDWVISLVVPIIADKNFYGIAGIDLNMEFIHTAITEANSQLYSGTGQIGIVSFNGIIAGVSGKQELTGQHLQKWIPNGWETYQKHIRQKKEYIEITSDRINVLIPLEIGRTQMPWGVIITIPKASVLAKARNMVRELDRRGKRDMTVQIAIGICIALLALIIIRFITRKIVEPIADSIRFAGQVAEGDFLATIDIKRNDEIGDLAKALNSMALQLKDNFMKIETQLQEIQLASIEKERSKKIIEESEKKYRDIFENAIEGIFQADLDKKFISVNHSMANYFGFESPSEMLSSITDIAEQCYVNPEESAKLYKNVNAMKQITGAERQFKRKDGSLFWGSISVREVSDEDGKRLYYEGAFIDITERKNAEKALKLMHNYLQNIINSMPSILVGVDLKGHVTQWNKMAEQATGIIADQAHGKILSHVLPQMISQMEKIAVSIQTREITQALKMPHKSKDSMRYEDVTIYPLISNGVEGAVIRVDDVTEKIRMEEMMMQSEKMLSVGGLAAGMAHEINNPLAGMMQTANVMANRLGEEIDLPANLKAAESAGTTMESIQSFMEARGILRMIKTINESGQRVAEIVDNMLSFARKSDDSISSHSPAELMDKTLELAATDYNLKKQYDFKTIEIVKEYEDNLPMLRCEGAKIQQVLLNVLRNGAQAMQENMEIYDGDKPRFILRLLKETKTKMLRIEIEDNGPGVDEAIIKRIFEPFFTTKPVGVGTGLGLSVSYFIITENHGGTMDVVSTPGKGATFNICLPFEIKGG